MSEYRVYLLDDGEHVREAADIDAADDRAAIAEAARLARARPVEIWRLDRYLCGFAPVDGPRAEQP